MSAKYIVRFLSLTAVAFLPTFSFALTETVNGVAWNYFVENDCVKVGSGNAGTRAISTSTSGTIVIPDRLGGKSVTMISDCAFESCTKLTSVIIPSTITNIGKYAFQNCTALSTITVPSSVTVVDHAAFHNCTSLKDVTVSDGVKIIGDWGFGGCSSLTNIVIPSSVERIDRAAFYNCSSLKEVTIPENMTVLDECIFQGCTSLTSLTVPPNITTIRNEFVDSCNSLSCIVFEGNAPVVTEKAFIGFGGKILVSKQSSGWCLDIPGIWNGVFVNYDDYVPPIGTWVSASNGLLACYPFNGDICDVSENDHVLVKDKECEWPKFTPDRFGRTAKAMLFDGNKLNHMRANRDDMRAVVSRTFTLAFWFQTTSSYLDYGAATEGASHYKGNYAIFPAHSGSTTAQGLGVKVGRDGICLMGHYGGDVPVLMTYSASINANWHHLAVTIQDNSAPILYLDGQKVATGATPTRTMNLGIRIGGDDYGYYTGKLDDVRIYNRALAANEIRALYEMVESSITYENLMGTTHTNPDVYTEGAYGTFLPPTELTGYEFMGWSPAAISAQTRGDVAVRATWGVPVVCDGSHVTVPLEWLDQSGIDLADGYTNVVVKQSGKVDASGNPMYVWQDYVAGTDPTDMNSRFTAAISVSNDVPYITWSPNLNTNGVVRKYTILGKESLTDTADWAPTNSTHRFFKVKVEMP